MSIPTVPNFDLTQIPVEGSTSFRSDASYVWGTIPSVIDGFNTSIVEINTSISGINTNAILAVNAQVATEKARVDAEESAASAKSDADRANAVVIPTEATYTYADIDSKNALQNTANMTGYGNTERVLNTERFMETDTPNVIVDTTADSVRFSDGLVDTLGEELVTNGDFSDGTTGWTQSDCAVIDGKLKLGVYAFQIMNNDVIKLKKISMYIEIIGAGSVKVRMYLPSIVDIDVVTETGFYTYYTIGDRLQFESVAGEVYIDNISVKELPQAALPLAPFATGSSDELLDDKTHGVTTQVNHTKGDIVVTGNELVTNGTFDTDVSGWGGDGTSGTVSFNSGRLRITNDGVDSYPYTEQIIATKTGLVYSVSYDIFIGTSSKVQIRAYDNGVLALKEVTSDSSGSITFTAINTSTKIVLYNFEAGKTGSYCEFDNISVTAVDDIHQAITDTTSGTLLTDTSKFKTIDYVTRFDVFGYTKTGYQTFKGTTLFDEDMSTDDIANGMGWSKLGNGLYSLPDGSEITSLRVVQRLNAGAYHPMFNIHGTRKMINTNSTGANFWYETHLEADTLYEVIRPESDWGSIGRVLGRTDIKAYDKVYNEGSGGLLGNGTYTTNDLELDVLSTELLSGSDLERGTEYLTGDVSQPSNSLLTSGSSLYVEVLGTDTTLHTDWKTRLLSGKAIQMTMTQSPDGTKTAFKLTRKVTTINQVLQSSDSGATWSVATPTFDSVANTVTFAVAPAGGDLIVISSTVRNKPLHQSDTLPIEKVNHKAVGTNSHSVYKGAMVANAVTNKVNVGNGLESRVLENSELGAVEVVLDIAYPVYNGKCYRFAGTLSDGIYLRIGSDNLSNVYTSSYDPSSSTAWELHNEYKEIVTTPQHSTIALDTEDSPAAKYFTSLAVDDNDEYVLQVVGEELAYNSATTSYDGQTTEFTQLTNGTLTDTNGNVVKTTNAIKRTGVFKGDK